MTAKKSSVTSLLFLVPAGVIYLSVVIIPVFYSVIISLFKWNGIAKMEFVGLNNFFTLFKDPVFDMALKNNLIWIILSLFATMTVSLGFAVMLNKSFVGRTFFRGFFYFPAVIASIAVAIIWRWIYNPSFGFINQLLKLLGSTYQQSWISSPTASIYAIFFASLWQSAGLPMIFFLAGLQTVPEEVLEAATIDGASNLSRFFIITMPMMKETFVIVIANLIVGAMKVFDVIMGLTAGGPNNATQMMSTYMYSQTFRYNNVGYGAAIAVLMVLFMLIVIVPYITFTARKD
ncbi:carbohydrate ABC transporter permease [Treponema primitia]|uniref:carbohydrate ABC transporter permease n=1 Tax=Treponema primitia TaxID=88058 RepID=UPI0002555002|nr:sugar ABC transporter permease [Treponema primitia]